MDSSLSSPPTSTPLVSMASPAGQPGGPSKMEQESPAGPEGTPMEPVSSKSSLTRAIAIPQRRDSLSQKREKDIVPELPAPRTDSIDSYTASFRQRRTETGWSVFTTASTITDATEPPSPDALHATFDDEPMIFEETYASSPRPFGFPSRTVTFQSPGPSRTSSFAFADPDNCRPSKRACSPDNTPVPRHSDILRMQNRPSSPRRGILRANSGINPNSGRPVRRESTSLPFRSRFGRRAVDESEGRSSSPQGIPELPTPTEPRGKAEDEIPDDMLRKIEPTADEADPRVACGEEAGADQEGDEEVHMSDSSDSADDINTPSSTASSSKPDDQLVQDACDHLLKNVFGVELQELGVTGAASEAYDSVNYCLEELSHLVPTASSMVHSSPPMREVPNHGNSRGGNPPIQPNNSGEYGGYPSGGNGNGGGQKRPNDDNDPRNQGDRTGGGGSGDRGSGGGSKRTKVAPEQPVEDQKLSCPFRKRNPVKFNVRDHQSCAVQSFPDISQLKRHVKNFHKQRSVSGFACPRCKQDMITKEGLANHLHVPNSMICTPQEAPPIQNPEDGITARIEDMLNGRKANDKVDTWEMLWRTLFPEDFRAPDFAAPDPHFIPPVELDEVHVQFKSAEMCKLLEDRIRDDERAGGAAGEAIEERLARIVASCTKHIEWVIASSRIQADNAPGRPRRNRSQGNGQSAKPGPGPAGQRRSAQHLTLPQPIPKKKGRSLNASESSLSSSLDTANSVESWANIEQLNVQQASHPHDTTGVLAMQQPMRAYGDLALDTEAVYDGDLQDLTLSATTGPAGSPAHLISPAGGPPEGPMIPPPQQAHLRDVSDGTSSVSHMRMLSTDSGIAGFDTASPYYSAIPAYRTNNLNMFAVGPGGFQGVATTMGGYPAAQMQAQMQMQAAAQLHSQMHQQQQTAGGLPFRPPMPVTMGGGGGGTIDPRMIHQHPNFANMGSGHGLLEYPPDGGGGGGGEGVN